MSAAGVRFQDNDFGREVLAGRNPFEVKTRAELHRYLGIVFVDPPFVPWPVDRALVAQRRADAPFEQQVLDAIGRGPEAFELQAQLPNIHLPVLLLWCRDDRVIDVSAAKVFADGLHNGKTVILEGCGHMPLMAAPEAVAQALLPAELALPP
jgi:pimeloyl-ACP methyl ester carboxylesterase